MTTYSLSSDVSSFVGELDKAEDERLYRERRTMKDLRRAKTSIRAMDKERKVAWLSIIREA